MAAKTDMESTNDVPDDWELNSLLLNLSRNTTDDELEDMKFLFSGHGGIGKKALSETKTTKQFFNILKERGFLDRNNLLFLQGLYWQIENKSSHRKIVKYAKDSRAKPVYFFEASEAPVNGFSHTKFHLAGSELSRRKVEELRSTVAQILCIEEKFVIWKGAKPFNSIIITFMVPSDVLDLLLDLTSEEKGYLIELNIDKFVVDDKEIILKGQSYDPPKVISEAQEIDRLMKRGKAMEKQIEMMELSIVEKSKQDQSLCEKQDHLQQKLDSMDHTISAQTKQLCAYNAMVARSYNEALIIITALIKIIFDNYQPEDVSKLSQQSALAYYRHCLDRVKRECPDKMDYIYELIDIATMMAVQSEGIKWKNYIESIKLQNHYLQFEQVELLTILNTNQTYHANRPLQSYIFSMKTRHSFGVEPMSAAFGGSATLHIKHIKTVFQEGDAGQTALMQISNLLTSRQIQTLLENSKLSFRDKQTIKENPTRMMSYIVPKDLDIVRLRHRVLSILGIFGDKQLLARVHQVFDALQLPDIYPAQPSSTKILKSKKRQKRRV